MKSFLFLLFAAVVVGKVYFHETFGDDWESRWVQSDWKAEAERGKLVRTSGQHGDGENHGVQTSEDARFYTYAAKFPESSSNKDKTWVLQYTVKHEQTLDCGGAYLKFLPAPVAGDDLSHFKGGEGETQYNVMFGPDWCGSGHKRIHAIFNYKGQNYLNERLTARAASDHLTHRYALAIHSNNSYTIYLDDEIAQYGSLAERPDYTMLPEKEIPDPAVSKPADWVDEPEMDDPEDAKPEGYDDIPATIADPEAAKPEDWDDELDGEWEAPQISNPEYKGEWKPKRIPNPDYKGPWQHPMIPNPEYSVPDDLYLYESWGAVGIEIWQVKSGTIFDNIMVTDSMDEADAAWEDLKSFRDAEKESFEKAEEERKKREAEEAEKAKAEAEAAKEEEAAEDPDAIDGDEEGDDDKDEL